MPADALAAWPVEAVCQEADAQGVLPLAAERLAGCEGAPSALQARLRLEASRHGAVDLLRESETRRVLEALSGRGLGVLLLKGAHLAYSYYARPDLRPRIDTDFLIPTEARDSAHAALLGLGYEPVRHVSGRLVTYQAPYLKRDPSGIVHIADLHWKIANPQIFADLLSYEELAGAACPLPRLSRAARGPCAVHALLIACMHRVAHHFEADLLIWLYDIHLIASQLRAPDWEEFLALARRRGVAAVCRRGLVRAAACFPTDVPPGVLADLEAHAGAHRRAMAAYLEPRRRHLHHVVSDLQALATWTDRWRLVREHLFPPVDYMRQVYAPASSVPLPLLYARRALRGAWRWLSPS